MARYNLIIKDATYLKLLQIAARQGKTMGKLLNEILDKQVELNEADGQLDPQPVCIVCGQKATIEGSGKGRQKLFVCSLHKDLACRLDGYRDARSRT